MKNTSLYISIVIFLILSTNSFSQSTCKSIPHNNFFSTPTTSIGQSYYMDGCGGNTFYSITLDRYNSGTASTGTLTIHEGDRSNINPIYQQSNIPFSASSGPIEILLAGGTGTLQFIAGDPYTFILTIAHQRSFYINTSNYYPQGYGYHQGLFYPNTDIASSIQTWSPLSVQLTKFDCKKIKEVIELDWITENEFNNAGFEIHRSANALDWVSLGFIQGNGTNTKPQEYSFIDKNPLEGQNYYRLLQMDYDNRTSYSSIESIEFSKEKEIYIQPNPIVDEMIISNGTGRATIYNLIGQTIKTFKIDNNTFVLDSKNLLPGHYILHIKKEDGNTISKQFVK